MVLVTNETRGKWFSIGAGRSALIETNRDSGVNALITLLTPVGRLRRITSITVKYSAVVSLDVTVTLLSGAGALWDVEQHKETLSATDTVIWYPSGDLFLSDADILEVLAPAGGAAVTSAVAIYSEIF